MAQDRRKLIAALAQTALATLFAGPLGGVRAAIGFVIDFLTNTPREVTYSSVLKDLASELEAVARSENLADSIVDQALVTADTAIERGGASVAECVDLQFDPRKVANRVVGRSARLLETLDEGASDMCRLLIERTYARMLDHPTALPGLEREFQRHVVTRLAEIDRLPEATAAAIRRAAAATLATDPRLQWDPDLYPETALVRAEFAAVPFHGRDPTLDEMMSWCLVDRSMALRLFVGAGGMGKTRLMMEACEHLRARGWTAGFLAISGDGGLSVDRLETSAPHLVVIDYAESRPETASFIAGALARQDGPPLRVIALARSKGEWWENLYRGGTQVGDFLEGPATSIKELSPLAPDVEERRKTFDVALKAFSARLDVRLADAPRPNLSGEEYDRVLFVHLAALAAVLGQDIADGRDLLDFALRRERTFWNRGIEAAGFPHLRGVPLVEGAALVTLTGGAADRDGAVRVLRKAPLLEDQSAVALTAVAELFHSLYPGDEWLDGVQPDLLGEHLVYRALQANRGLLGTLDAGA